MKSQALRCTKIEESRLGLSVVFPAAFCLLIVCFFVVSSSFAQSVVTATRSVATASAQSIVSLAPSQKPAASLVARRVTDSRFENAPANYRVFAAASVGESTGAEVLTLNFAGQTTITEIKLTNKDFVIEPGGTCLQGSAYTRGESCSLIVRFNPQGPGHRLGLLKITHSAEATPASFGLTGNGYSPVVSFTPSLITTVPVTVSSGNGIINNATSLAVGGGDTLYVDDVGNNRIREIDSSGALNAITPVFATPASVAVDSLGIVYSANVSGSTYYFSFYTPWGSQTAYGTTYTPGTCTPSAPCLLTSVGLGQPANVSIDAYDDLFFEEITKGGVEMPVANVGGGNGSLSIWYLTNQFAYATGKPASFAVDAGGNLYTTYAYAPGNSCFMMEEPLYNAEYSPVAKRVAGGVACGFSGDGGQARSAEISSSIGQIAFDIAGNLYFADSGNQRIRRIDAATGIIRTIAGNGTAGYTGDNNPATIATLRTPSGLGVDSQGQVYILSNSSSTGTAQVVRKVGATGGLIFPSTTEGASSITLQINVANTGNSTLNLVRESFTGTNRSDFSIDSDATSCNLVAGSFLAAGQSCQIGLIFKPSGVGSRTATLNLFDNTVTGTNKVSLRGPGVAPVKLSFTAPASSQISPGTKTSVSVSVSSDYSTPTGRVSFTIDGKAAGSGALNSGAASVTLPALPTGTHQVVATYNGDKEHASAKATKTLTVN